MSGLNCPGRNVHWPKRPHTGMGRYGIGEATYKLHLCASVVKQYNLVPDVFGWEGNCGPGGK